MEKTDKVQDKVEVRGWVRLGNTDKKKEKGEQQHLQAALTTSNTQTSTTARAKSITLEKK